MNDELERIKSFRAISHVDSQWTMWCYVPEDRTQKSSYLI
jgi:hypothetical protein